MVRLELDKDTAAILDEIKASEWSISGKGNAETIRYLARFYKTHKKVDQVLQEELSAFRKDLPQIMTRGLKTFFVNLVTIPDE